MKKVVAKVKTVREIGIFRISLVREKTVDYYGQRVVRPADAFQLIRNQLVDADRERFGVILLNTKNAPVAINEVSVGDLSSAVVHPREVFKPAVLAGAASVILYHNHPSGDPTPSRQDVAITERVAEAGEIIGIEVLDHIIVGDDRFVSLRESGAWKTAA